LTTDDDVHLCANTKHVVVAGWGVTVFNSTCMDVSHSGWRLEKIAAAALVPGFLFLAMSQKLYVVNCDTWRVDRQMVLPEGNTVLYLAAFGSTLFALSSTILGSNLLSYHVDNVSKRATFLLSIVLPRRIPRGLSVTRGHVMTLGDCEIDVYDHSLHYCSTILYPDVEAFAASDDRLFVARRYAGVTSIVSQPLCL
jgi:hypothetical protein